MKIITNTKLIKRNTKIGQYLTIIALVTLGAGLYITFKMPDKFVLSMGCLLVGFFLSQIGMYYGNRWGRSPRPDEIIDKNMKGLGREYTIYHYTTPASHFLTGPAGLWVIMPYYQGGKIIFDGKRWKSKGGGFARTYMRLFGQETMGRPNLEADAEIRSVTQHLTRFLSDGFHLPEIKAILLFTSPQATLEVENSPYPAMKTDELKEYLKSRSKEKPISDEELTSIRDVLPKPEK